MTLKRTSRFREAAGANLIGSVHSGEVEVVAVIEPLAEQVPRVLMPDHAERTLLARLELNDGTLVKGIVTDTTEQEVVVAFDPDAKVILPIGEKVNLSVAGTGTARMFESRVIERIDQAETVRYRFRSPEFEAVHVVAMRSRRQAVRVRVGPPAVEVHVNVRGKAHGFVAEITDISRGGLGMLLPLAEEQELYQEKMLETRFLLPGEHQRFALVGEVRYRALVGISVRYGIQFDSELTPGFANLQERVNRYVMRRQVEMLREARDSRD